MKKLLTLSAVCLLLVSCAMPPVKPVVAEKTAPVAPVTKSFATLPDAVSRAATELVSLPEIKEAVAPPFILIDPVKSGCEKESDADAVAAALRAALNDVAAEKAILQDRDEGWQAEAQQQALRDSMKSHLPEKQRAASTHYSLAAYVSPLKDVPAPEGQKNFLLTLRFVAGGSNQVWRGSYRFTR